MDGNTSDGKDPPPPEAEGRPGLPAALWAVLLILLVLVGLFLFAA